MAQRTTIGRWLCPHDWRVFGRWRAFTFERCRRCGEVRSAHDADERVGAWPRWSAVQPLVRKQPE